MVELNRAVDNRVGPGGQAQRQLRFRGELRRFWAYAALRGSRSRA
ncbi:hypothetical protein [Acrocarpospora catenulata]|nr:hypothetical protein [Acrocarpospora catenulata]